MIRDAMRLYFAQLEREWAEKGSLPRMPIGEEPESPAVVRTLDDEDLVEWRPVPVSDSSALQLPDGVHPSVAEYLSSYWFLACGGAWGQHRLQLEAVSGPLALQDYRERLCRYRASRKDGEWFAPIGFDFTSSRLLVVQRDSGEVFLEDDAGTRSRLASGLEEIMGGLAAS